MITLLYMISFATIGFSQDYPLILGDTNSWAAGSVYSMPNGNILVLANTFSYTDNSIYTKIYTVKGNGEVIAVNKFNFTIDDILIHNQDSIYFIYPKFTNPDTNYLFVELVDANYKCLAIDSTIIVADEGARAQLFLTGNEMYFYYDNYSIRNGRFNLTLGSINKPCSFANNVNNVKLNTYGTNDVLVTQQKEWILFFSGYFVKLDSNYNTILVRALSNENEMDFGFNSFWLSDKYFITGGIIYKNNYYNQVDEGYYLAVAKSYGNNLVTRKQIVFDNYSGNDNSARDNVVKADTCFYFFGSMGIDSTDINFDADGRNRYLFVACIDFELNVIWEKTFAGDRSYGAHSLCITPDNKCVILAARSIVGEEFGSELYLLKLNAEGDIVTSAHLTEPKHDNIVFYPNPGNVEFNIKLGENTEATNIYLFSMLGRKVLMGSIQPGENKFSTSGLTNGVYLYQIIGAKGVIDSGKWVKQY